MKKLIRDTVCVILTVLSVSLCVGCYDNYREIVVQDVNKYLQVDSYVDEELATCFSGFLPTNDIIEHDDATYYYFYNCAPLDNPSFAIYLCNKIVDDTVFMKEKERIIALSDNAISDVKQRTVYYVGNLEKAIELYTDDDILDGLCIRFELAIVDEQKNSIEYLVAAQQDNNKQLDVILCILKELRGQTNY